ncbi:RNase H [Vibrio phage V-YDF132]|nr:RNase H [Vibrio phage V-YDF132]
MNNPKGIKVDNANKDSKLSNQSMQDTFVTIFTDASWCPDTKAYGCAYWVKIGRSDDALIDSWGGINCKNAEEAEVEALRKSVEVVYRSGQFINRIIVIQSDCLNALNRVVLPDRMQKLARHVKLKHVRAHTNGATKRSKVNEKMDKLAKAKMRAFRAYIREKQNA